MADTSLWYKDAIIYQLHVRAFYDSDGDGVGDFRGLTEKLDYIHNLGVTAIWLLPFYPSPLKDDGYDIADYTTINEVYGTLGDFKRFLKEAHARDLRVITELVVNHTSDKHPWFQRARKAKPGSRWRDFYVWSDDPHKYKDARIIFRDFETSNWHFDEVAGAYYWHRFYHHQPDLNFENPEVRAAVFKALDFWLGMGVDGLRLDAVPYIFEREGTTCENLPETHAFLKELRRHVDENFDDRMLLAEANQWPEDAASYFGDGDECHMNFHFPLMPRLFMALEQEDRFPVIDILEQTPRIPENCQWMTFLRNHDELTLEMVTDEERDYMYRVYAQNPLARINLGIRRRLAPLLSNNRRKIELMNGLLFSLPGTPVIYYGDEIGIGDNIYLGDRDSVRTPMQWNADRNSGFSRANPQKLYLPVVVDPEFHYTANNVEANENNSQSLLWWMRRLITLLRKRSGVFGRGTLEFLYPDNPRTLAFLRCFEGETALVVANLSRFAQYVELDLSRFNGMVPVELFGQTRFPQIGELPYLLTLGPHAFHLFSLQPQVCPIPTLSTELLPRMRVSGDWQNVFSGRAKNALEKTLTAYLGRQQWFHGRARTIQHLEIQSILTHKRGDGLSPFRLLMIRVHYPDAEEEDYLLPLTWETGERARLIANEATYDSVAWIEVDDGGESGLLYDALLDRETWTAILDEIAQRRRIKAEPGELVAHHTKAFRRIRGSDDVPLEPSAARNELLYAATTFGDRLMLKIYRQIEEGINPDLEINQFLSLRSAPIHRDNDGVRSAPTGPAGPASRLRRLPVHPGRLPVWGNDRLKAVATNVQIPQLAGSWELHTNHKPPRTLGVLYEYAPHEGTAWTQTLDELGRYFERVRTHAIDEKIDLGALPRAMSFDGFPATVGAGWPGRLGRSDEVSSAARELIGPFVQSVELMGQRTAELHLALASDDEAPAFAPEPFSTFYQRGLYQAMRSLTKRTLRLLRRRLRELPDDVCGDAASLLDGEADLLNRFGKLREHKLKAFRIRCHGHLKLQQLLYSGKDYAIVDFEGDPSRPVSERRIKRSPLRDVAGMLRSFHYASQMPLLGEAPGIGHPLLEEMESLSEWADLWYALVSTIFASSYFGVAETAKFFPETGEEIQLLLEAYLLEKALDEVHHELTHRPDFACLCIPIRGILSLLERT